MLNRSLIAVFVLCSIVLLGQSYNIPFSRTLGPGTDFTSQFEGCWFVQNTSVNDECTGSETNNATDLGTATYSTDGTYDLNYYILDGSTDTMSVANTASLSICNSARGCSW